MLEASTCKIVCLQLLILYIIPTYSDPLLYLSRIHKWQKPVDFYSKSSSRIYMEEPLQRFIKSLAPEHLRRIRELSNSETPLKQWIYWFYPELSKNSTSTLLTDKKQSNEPQSGKMFKLGDLSTFMEMTEMQKMNNTKSSPYNISETIESPMVRKDLFYSSPVPYLDGVSWDPLGISLEKGENFISLADMITKSIPLEVKEGISESEIKSLTIPPEMMRLFDSLNSLTRLQWIKHYSSNPNQFFIEFLKAFRKFDILYSKLITNFKFENHNSGILTHINPKDPIGIITAIPSDSSVNNMQLHFIKEEIDLSYGQSLLEKSSTINSMHQLKEILKTTEWLKTSDAAQKDQAITGISYNDFDEALIAHPGTKSVKPRQLVSGRIVYLNKRFALVDIKSKFIASLTCDEAFYGTKAPNEGLKSIFQINETSYFEVLRMDDENIELTLRSIHRYRNWEKALNSKSNNRIIYAKILSTNTGGAVVDAEGLRGFLPTNQISPSINMEKLIDSEIPCVIILFDPMRATIILSNSQAEFKIATSKYSKSQLIDGVVEKLSKFGLIIKLDDQTTGLVPWNQISSQHIEDPNSIFPKGSKIKAKIYDFNPNTGYVQLSTKVLEKNPGDIIKDKEKTFRMAEKSEIDTKSKESEARMKQKTLAKNLLQSLGLTKSYNATNKKHIPKEKSAKDLTNTSEDKATSPLIKLMLGQDQ